MSVSTPRTGWRPLVPELSVSDLALSLAFYRQLGFDVCFERGAPPFAYLDLAGAQLMLEQAHDGAWQTAPLAPPFGRGVNFQIEVADATALAAQLLASGVALFRELRDTWYATSATTEEGQREFLVQDPDGYLLRLSQPLGERVARS